MLVSAAGVVPFLLWTKIVIWCSSAVSHTHRRAWWHAAVRPPCGVDRSAGCVSARGVDAHDRAAISPRAGRRPILAMPVAPRRSPAGHWRYPQRLSSLLFRRLHGRPAAPKALSRILPLIFYVMISYINYLIFSLSCKVNISGTRSNTAPKATPTGTQCYTESNHNNKRPQRRTP